MKLNYVGIVGAIIAFISIALPWWTVSVLGATGNWYLYNAGDYGAGLNLWYNWVALLLIILGGVVGLAGSTMLNGKKMLIGGGLLALLSIIIFAAGLQMDLSSHNALVGIFSTGTYSTYLSYGFWLALVAAIIMLVAMRYSKPTSQTPSPQPSPPPPTTGT
jgi:hypothetical protein